MLLRTCRISATVMAFNTSCFVSNFPFVLTLMKLENLFGISLAENLLNNCFRFSFSPTKSLATSTSVRASVLSLWLMQHHAGWFSLEFPVVEGKYLFTRFKAENDLLLTALVANMTSNNFPRVSCALSIPTVKCYWKTFLIWLFFVTLVLMKSGVCTICIYIQLQVLHSYLRKFPLLWTIPLVKSC